ncbi:hypothetical protein J4E90_007833 [Alternaria incomplexa]|uniref:uncharacterized protein n=1 Tax=Alternaria incomplexa TaxID=1187928 RepID=UPI00221F0E82|nr:uncharacterized protein J4E90_007833 [Alternaria incomplexa]KAI4910398.1 hypothetical protein J4E90_007833 [Alternaria incomplexa]
MATADTDAPFRFMDLPGELRNKVYTLLLCSFGPAPDPIQEIPKNLLTKGSFETELVSAQHCNDSAILRVNSQVHREAYDVMVKTNRFVRITSPGNFSLHDVIAGRNIPVVASGQLAAEFNEQLVDITIPSPGLKFNGYADGDQPVGSVRPTSLVILGCYLQKFCNSFEMAKTILPGLANTATFVITIAPMLTQKGPWYQDDLTDFFSETTQMDLLRPLATMRGIKHVEIHGLVAPEMATELKDLMMSGKWNDPRSVIDFMKETKDYGAQFYREGLLMEAFSTWRSSMHEIDRLREGITWEKLIKIGGEPWIDQIAALQCSLGLNSALAMIMIWGLEPTNVAMPPQAGEVHRNLALVSLSTSAKCDEPGYWKEGYTWVCPTVLKAKIMYRHALCIRLWNERSQAVIALGLIGGAMSLVPNDPVVRKEAEAIVIWARSM